MPDHSEEIGQAQSRDRNRPDPFERMRARARMWGPCDGCGHPYRADEHIPGQTKCCPDCTHMNGETTDA